LSLSTLIHKDQLSVSLYVIIIVVVIIIIIIVTIKIEYLLVFNAQIRLDKLNHLSSFHHATSIYFYLNALSHPLLKSN